MRSFSYEANTTYSNTWVRRKPYDTALLINAEEIAFEVCVWQYISMFFFINKGTLTWKAGWQNFLKIFFQYVGGGIKKNTIILTKAQKEWREKNLPFIDWNTPFATTNSYESFNTISLGWSVCCCGIVHVLGTWKGLLYSASLCSGPETGLAQWVRITKKK